MSNLIVTCIKLLILINCLSLNEGQLIDYPLNPTRGSVIIASTLTNQSNQEVYTVKETLIEYPKVHGKIEITHGTDKIDVFYNQDYPTTRLVIHENECYKLEYKTNGWVSMIPTIDSPLLNTALLLGPSFYYRLVDQMNQAVDEMNVEFHDEKMKSFRLKVGQDFQVSFIFPVKMSPDDGIRQPDRLKLVSNSRDSETLFYDIHYEKPIEVLDEILASVTLGIGCSEYLSVNQPFPLMNKQPYHVKIVETYKVIGSDTKSTYNQMFFDPIHNVSYVTTTGDQFEFWEKSLKLIVDYDLGIQYQLSDGKCHIMKIVSDLDLYRYDGNLLVLNPITLGIEGFRYVGKVDYMHRSRLVDVWESIEFADTENYNTYAKVVTTQFMLEQLNDLGLKYIPIAVERKFYKKISDKMKLIESKQRDFFDYDEINFDETDYRQSFQLSDCYDSPDDKMYLTMKISSEDTNQGLEIASKNLYSLREKIIQIISSNLGVSYLRITSINIEFNSMFIVAKVEIIREPDLPSSLQSFDRKYTLDSFRNFEKVSIKDPVECLKVLSNDPVTYVINCMGLNNLCVGLVGNDEVPEANNSGSYCTVYSNGFNILKNLAKEVTLKQLLEQFTKLNGISFDLACTDCPNRLNFTIVNVVQDTPSLDVKETRLLFKTVENGFQLTDDTSTSKSDASTFGDCYQACASSVCETFSFCQSPVDRSLTECHITGKVYEFLDKDIVPNSYCAIYVKNKLLDYHKITSKKFIESKSGPSVRTEDECARACAEAGEDCYSFQICDSHYCSFAGQYTVSNMVPANFCDVYIPKRIHNFDKNDNQILVSSLISSEVDLTLDQCASLCSFTPPTISENGCRSFNYCPKGEGTSLCQLSNETISSSDMSAVASSNNCANYEAIGQSKQFTPKNYSVSTTKSVLTLIFFTILGLTVGLATPWAHNRVKNKFRRKMYRSSPNLDNNNDAESVI